MPYNYSAKLTNLCHLRSTISKPIASPTPPQAPCLIWTLRLRYLVDARCCRTLEFHSTSIGLRKSG